MNKTQKVIKYISEYLEIDKSIIEEDSNIYELMEISSVHEDDKKFFMLNFLDNFEIYSAERDAVVNYKYIYATKALYPFRFIASFLNIFTQKWIEFSEYKVFNLIEFANRGYLNK
ncbi:hypothetical protein GC173_09385 [bacterium]|nr:hypothetical protein [bacterium]